MKIDLLRSQIMNFFFLFLFIIYVVLHIKGLWKTIALSI